MRPHLLVNDVQNSNGVLPAASFAHSIDQRVEGHNVCLEAISLQQEGTVSCLVSAQLQGPACARRRSTHTRAVDNQSWVPYAEQHHVASFT